MFLFGKLLNSILILLVLSNTIKEILNEPSNKKCIINNQKYSNEYILNWMGLDEVVQTIQKQKVKSFNEIEWTFKSISDEAKHTYLIKSSHNNKYLCASTGFADNFYLRKYVALFDLGKFKNMFSKSAFDACKWRLDQVKNRENVFKLINIQYNGALYSPGFLFKYSIYRKTFVWNGKLSNGDEFKWKIVCQN